MAHCAPAPDKHLELKVASSREELDACFSLLHDTYVGAGLMAREESGLRVTPYSVLPATATLCAKYDGKVVGTVSVIADNPFGLPLQRIFDLTGVRARRGTIAEVSGLAVAPAFRRRGGIVLFPLLKLVYEYCTQFLAARHLVIAAHPRHFELFESLFCFRRLTGRIVAHYDFVNGAPAIGGSLDLQHAPEILRKQYGDRPPRRNIYRYFAETPTAAFRLPERPADGTLPRLPPALIDEFCNRRTAVFASLSERRQALLHLIFNQPDYCSVLPPLPPGGEAIHLRRHRRFPVRRSGRLFLAGGAERMALQVVEVSRHGFRARTPGPVPGETWMTAVIQLGAEQVAHLHVITAQDTIMDGNHLYGFRIGDPDLAWRKFINALYDGHEHSRLAPFTNPAHDQ
jgi:hypothetical protein